MGPFNFLLRAGSQLARSIYAVAESCRCCLVCLICV